MDNEMTEDFDTRDGDPVLILIRRTLDAKASEIGIEDQRHSARRRNGGSPSRLLTAAACVVVVSTGVGAIALFNRSPGTGVGTAPVTAPSSADPIATTPPTDAPAVVEPGDGPTGLATSIMPADRPSGVVAYPDAWAPVELAPGVVPWYHLADATASQFGAAELGPSAINARCSEWTADDDSVTCNSVFTEGQLPAVTYQDSAQGRSVAVNTVHEATTAEEYAVHLSRGADTGYDDPPLDPEPIQIGERTAQLIDPHPEETYTRRRVTLEMAPGVFVAVESMGFTLEELVGFAEQLEPATLNAPIPLDLVPSDGLAVVFSGAVVDGQVCALSSRWANGGPQDCTLLGDADLIAFPADGLPLYTGLVSGDVASITLSFTDGSTSDVEPTAQPVGSTQAFAFAIEQAPAESIIARDQQGNELARAELDPADAYVAVPTTASVHPASVTTTSG